MKKMILVAMEALVRLHCTCAAEAAHEALHWADFSLSEAAQATSEEEVASLFHSLSTRVERVEELAAISGEHAPLVAQALWVLRDLQRTLVL